MLESCYDGDNRMATKLSPKLDSNTQVLPVGMRVHNTNRCETEMQMMPDKINSDED